MKSRPYKKKGVNKGVKMYAGARPRKRNFKENPGEEPEGISGPE